MDWYVVRKDYVSYLSQFDKTVGFVDYGEKLKIHVGTILTIGDFKYYVPISSAKPKHQNMSNSLDFHKLQDKQSGYLYAVLNINNMIPVPDHCVTQLKYDKISDFRAFKDDKERINYIYLLQKEKLLMDDITDILKDKAQKLYRKCLQFPDSSLARRCCKFKLLEEKCFEWKTAEQSSQDGTHPAD